MSIYTVTLTWNDTPFHPPLMDAVLGLAGEWVRFNNMCWLLKTTRSPYDVQVLLRKHLRDGDQFLVLPFDPQQAAGFAPPWMWTWMGKTPPAAPPTIAPVMYNPLLPKA